MFNIQYLEVVQDQLSQFAAQSNFNEIITTAFGNQVNQTQLEILQKQLLDRDHSIIPDIQILFNGELGSANGAYAADLDKIFISSDFLRTASAKAVSLMLMEEIGHRIDKLLNNNVDSPGDEGEIFSLLVNGKNLSPEIISELKSQDDHGEIVLSENYLWQVVERKVVIEKAVFTGTEGDDNDPRGGSSISGFETNDSIYGLGGDDRIFGQAGNDYIDGGSGDDLIYGGLGDDLIYGGLGDDDLGGSVGDDYIDGGSGNDILYGEPGNDTLNGSGGGKDNFFGGLGNDTYKVVNKNQGSRIGDSDGIDTLRLREDVDGFTIPLYLGKPTKGFAGLKRTETDLIIDINRNGIATQEDDISIANFFNNTVAGSGFIETLENLSGNAVLDWFKSQASSQVNVSDFKKDPAKYMGAIRDYDGNDLGKSSSWKLLENNGDIQGDGDLEDILVNPAIGRFATVGSVNGKIDFSEYGLNGDTRVVGIYIDPTLKDKPQNIGGPFDSQRRFQNDLRIDNLKVLDTGDYNNDGFQDLYFKLGDGSAVLRAVMFADGNIQYANYQSKADLTAFMTTNNVSTFNNWNNWL